MSPQLIDMVKKIQKEIIVVVALLMLVLPSRSFAMGGEFATSVVYGTLAGTIIGVGTLAFTDNPAGNLNAVARGASWGLYAGIALGLYVTYGVGDDEEEEGVEGEQQPGAPQPAPGLDGEDDQALFNLKKARVAFVPVVQQSAQGQKGFGAALQVFNIRF